MMVAAPRDSRMAISSLLAAPEDELPALKASEDSPKDHHSPSAVHERPPSPPQPVTPPQVFQQLSHRHGLSLSLGTSSPPPTFSVTGLLHVPTISASAEPIASATGSSAGKRGVVKRRMTNSERGKLYRSRRKNYMDTLTRQVQGLQQEISTLESCGRMRHELLQTLARYGNGSPHSSLPTTPYSRVVCEYFAAFELGFQVFMGDDADGSVTGGELQLRQSPRQEVFMDTLVDQQLVFDGNVGIEHLSHCWDSHTRAHQSLRLKLSHLDVVALEPRAIVVASGDLKVRFARRHLRGMFPAIVAASEGEGADAAAERARVERLLGLEVSYPVRVHFYFGQDGKIAQYDAEVDLVGGWTEALGSVREAAELLENLSLDGGH